MSARISRKQCRRKRWRLKGEWRPEICLVKSLTVVRTTLDPSELASPQQQSSRTERSKASSPISTRPDSSASISAEAAGPTEPEETLAVPVMPITLSVETAPQIAIIEPVAIEGPSSTQNRPPSVQQRRPSLQERPPSSQRSHSVASPLGRVERSPSGLDELVLSRPTMDPTSSTAAGPEGLISVGYGVEPGSIGAAYSDVTFGKLPSESIQPETPAAAFAVPQGGAHDIQGLVFEQQVVEEKAGHTPGFDGWELPPAPPRNALEEEPSAPAMEIIEQPIAPSVAMEGTEHLDNNAVVGTESMAGALDQNFPEGYDPYHGYGGEDTYGYEQGRPAEGFVVSEQVDGQDQYVSHIGEQGYPGYEHYDAGLAPPQTDSGWPSVEHVEVGDGWVAPPTAEETEDAVADLAQTSDETNVVYEPGPEAFGETQPQVSGGDGMEFQHFVEGEGYGLPPSSEQPNYGNGAYADYGPQDEAYIAEDADGFGGDANASFMSSFAAAYIRDDEDGDVIDHGFEENRAPLETSYHESGYESGQQFAENALSQNDFPDHQEYAHDQQFIPAGNTCPNCNKNNDVDANFCSKCGSKLGVSDNAPTISAALVEPVGATVDQGSTSANFPAQSVLPTAPVGAWNQGPVGPNPYAKPAISPARSKTSSPAQGAHPSAAVAAAMAAEHQRFRLSPAISESGRPSLNRPPIAREEHSIKDPLGRTRGHCLAMFGFGGKLLTMVPIKQSRFNAALNATVEKIYPGNVVIRPIRALNLPALEAEFVKIERWRGPILGPKAKPNKKDSVKAVYAIVQALETQLSSFHGNDGEPKALAQERIALWKIIGAAIDNDGLFSGKSGGVTTPAVVNILKELAGSRQSVGGIFGAIEAALLDGDRLRACNIARENGQWAHALVIASFIDRGTYSDVLSAFAKSQFEGGEAAVAETAVTPERIPTLRVLYNLFAGVTGDAAVVDFMPPERTDMPTTEELNEWRYILAIILANRTSGDSAAVTALGDLLRSHSRLHAAQICYAVSLQTSAVSGLDFPNVRTVLFDVDHVGKFGMQRPRFFLSPEAVQLSEAFEVAQILANASNVGQGSLPHLQAYKLAYAWRLAELGFADIAARYCESIEEIVNVYSKGSPYFNRRFLECLKDLDVRIAGMNVMSTVAGAGDAKDGGTWLKRMTKLDGWMTALDKGLNKFMNGAVGMDTTEAAPAADSMVPHVPMAPLHAGVDGSTGGMDSQTFVPFVVSAEVPAMYGQAGFQAEGTMLTGEQLMYYNPDGTQPAEQREQDQYGYYEGDQQGQWQQDGGFDGSGQYQGTYEQDNQYGDGQYGDQTGYDANYNEAQGYGEQGYADQAYGVDQGYGGDDGYGANQTYEGQDYAIQGEYEGYDQQTYGEQSPHGDQGAAEGYGQQSYPTQDSDDLPAVPAETDDYGTEAPWDDLPTVPTDSPISFNPAMMPTVGQSDFSVASAEPPVPAVKPSVPQTHADFDDDLGLGNSKPKSDKPKEEKEESSKDVSKKQEGKFPSSSTAALFELTLRVVPLASGGKTWLSGITGLFKRPPGGPVRADLGEENSFYFDKELGRWVNKKAGSAAAAPAPLPPPPMGRPAGLGGNAPGPATGPGIAPPGAVSAGPAPSNPMGSFSAGATGGSSKRRGAANRYVDVLGSGGSVPASRPTASFLPTPGIAAPGATNLLRPMMVPAPAMGSGSGSDHWGSAGADQQDGGDGRS